jgi:hypothetical protein
MIFGLSRLYHGRLGKGAGYLDLKPVVGIWLLDQPLWPADPAWHHQLALRTQSGRIDWSHHLQLHVLELPKHRVSGPPAGELDPWMAFFRQAGGWSRVPDAYKTPGTEAAMAILRDIRENSEASDMARRRQDALRIQRDIAQVQREQAAELAQEKQRAEAEKQRAETEKQRAEAEKQRAEAEKQRAETEKQRAETEKQRAETEKQRAETEKLRADRLEAELQALRQRPDRKP